MGEANFYYFTCLNIGDFDILCPNPQLIVINSFEMAGDIKVVALQEKLSSETEKFRALQKELQKCLSSAQQLEAQLKENEVVKEELGLVKDDSNVYKLIGPVLVKQDLVEARSNVDKRLQYIEGEVKRNDSTLTDLKKKQLEQKEVIDGVQKSLIELSQKLQPQPGA